MAQDPNLGGAFLFNNRKRFIDRSLGAFDISFQSSPLGELAKPNDLHRAVAGLPHHSDHLFQGGSGLDLLADLRQTDQDVQSHPSFAHQLSKVVRLGVEVAGAVVVAVAKEEAAERVQKIDLRYRVLRLMTKLHTYLNFAGDAEEAFLFYKSVFGGEFRSAIRFKDFPMQGVEIPEKDADKMMHIALPVGEEEVLMASDILESQGQELRQGNNSYIMVAPETKEEADRIFNALSQGGEIEMPIADQPWGDYYGSFRDKFGVMWMVDVAGEQPAGTS